MESRDLLSWKLLSCHNNPRHLGNLQVSLLRGGAHISTNVEKFKRWFYGKSMSEAEIRFEHSCKNWQNSRVRESKTCSLPARNLWRTAGSEKREPNMWWILQWDLWGWCKAESESTNERERDRGEENEVISIQRLIKVWRGARCSWAARASVIFSNQCLLKPNLTKSLKERIWSFKVQVC